ncbi:MAG: DNA repair protein RecN, partial [Acidobacteriota bacterium]
MLIELHIRNLAVVEEATIDLGTGFNVLSGETGAGKSIVVDSLALLSGVRASTDQIRTGAETLSVTGVFEPGGDGFKAVLEEAGLEPESDQIVIRREVTRSGRNRAYIDDRPATARLLADLAPHLVRIHGQREELGLVDPELQRTWLDRMGGAKAEKLLSRVAEAWEAVDALRARLHRVRGDASERLRRIDNLRFMVEEIDGAGCEVGEEEALRQERNVLRHAESISHALGDATAALFGDGDDGGHAAVSRALQGLEGVMEWEPGAAAWVSELREIEIRLGELEPELSRRFEEVEADPRRLDAVEERLATLERLFKKYGGNTEAVLETWAQAAQELQELEDAASGGEELEAELGRALEAYVDMARQLSTARAQWGATLASGVIGHVKELALEKARFEARLELRPATSSPVKIDGVAVEAGPLGVDHVVYDFSPNPGEELRPLAKVASGGELSRLYLAVQLASRDVARAGLEGPSEATLVFDEVDAGISGAEAAVLG